MSSIEESISPSSPLLPTTNLNNSSSEQQLFLPTEKDDLIVSWFVRACNKPGVISHHRRPIVDRNEASKPMTMCKVFLFGLKPCDMSYNIDEKLPDTSIQRQRKHSLNPSVGSKTENVSGSENDYLNVHIKPVATPTSAVRDRSSTSRDVGHEVNPIRVIIRKTSRGRHNICVSQTLLRAHTSEI